MSGAIGKELARIQGAKASIEAEEVVAFARNPKTALHARFEWDNSKAAHEHRLEQARRILRAYVTVLDPGDGTEQTMRFFAVLRDAEDPGAIYRRTEDVLADPEQRALLVQEMLRRLDGVIASYPLPELRPVRRAIERCRSAAETALVAAE